MVATVQGDIYYVRNGRVPIRAPGTIHRPILAAIPPTTGGAFTRWTWQIENPPQAYMHNCNVTPFAMMKDSPLTPEICRPTYNATHLGATSAAI